MASPRNRHRDSAVKHTRRDASDIGIIYFFARQGLESWFWDFPSPDLSFTSVNVGTFIRRPEATAL